VDLERGEALADRHQLDDVDVHVRGLAGRPFDRGGDVAGGQRLGSGVDGSGSLAVAGGRLQSEGQPRVVDQDVDLGEVGREFGREPLDAGAVAHVEGQREQDVGTEFLGQVGEPLGPPRRRDDPVAQRREPAGGSGPEAGARAGDEYSSHGMHPSAPAWRYRAAE
jgi:hypothetical protein